LFRFQAGNRDQVSVGTVAADCHSMLVYAVFAAIFRNMIDKLINNAQIVNSALK